MNQPLHRLLPAALCLLLLAGAATTARARGTTPDEAGIDEHLGGQVALDAVLRDEDGNDVTLRRLVDKPTILTLVYYHCPNICLPLLNGVADVGNVVCERPVSSDDHASLLYIILKYKYVSSSVKNLNILP